jgi:hypothetical protein
VSNQRKRRQPSKDEERFIEHPGVLVAGWATGILHHNGGKLPIKELVTEITATIGKDNPHLVATRSDRRWLRHCVEDLLRRQIERGLLSHEEEVVRRIESELAQLN